MLSAPGTIIFKPIWWPCLPRHRHWQLANAISIRAIGNLKATSVVEDAATHFSVVLHLLVWKVPSSTSQRFKCLRRIRVSQVWSFNCRSSVYLLTGWWALLYQWSFSRTVSLPLPASENTVTPYYSDAVNQLYWITSQPWPRLSEEETISVWELIFH